MPDKNKIPSHLPEGKFGSRLSGDQMFPDKLPEGGADHHDYRFSQDLRTAYTLLLRFDEALGIKDGRVDKESSSIFTFEPKPVAAYVASAMNFFQVASILQGGERRKREAAAAGDLKTATVHFEWDLDRLAEQPIETREEFHKRRLGAEGLEPCIHGETIIEEIIKGISTGHRVNSTSRFFGKTPSRN